MAIDGVIYAAALRWSRLGQLQEVTDRLIRTDCAVGGDSGGTLFDMHGRVVGIHSRIGERMEQNIHGPGRHYRDTWDRLARADVWGSRLNGRLGMKLDDESKDAVSRKSLPEATDRDGFKAAT